MYDNLFSKISSEQDCRVIFIDFFDTIVTKNVSHQYLYRLWAKHMIRELGVDLRIDELYLIRNESEGFLAQNADEAKNKVSYKQLIDEVYTRLVCTNALINVDKSTFSRCFENSEYHAEILVQKPNSKIIEVLKGLHDNGYRIFVTADVIGSSALIKRYLEYHGLATVIKEVIVSSEHEDSFKNGDLYLNKLNELKLQPQQAVVIGHDKEVFNDKGIRTFGIGQKPQVSYTNVPDQKRYRKIVRELYRKCNRRPAPPHSDYILFYYVYIERLYKKAKKDNIKNICFLAREGLFLKKLFDHYQSEVSINEAENINAHYFKASRNSLMLASFKDLKIEEFEYLRRRWPTLSVNSFLKNFNFSEETTYHIVKAAGLETTRDVVIEDFLDSDTFMTLKKNPEFIKAYDDTRNSQKQYFEAYLDSFNIDVKSEGIHLSDVGWGGTMQNRLYAFFEEKIKVHGYYLGVREINNIREDTIKYGLNFSVYPYITFFDHILMANVELNEQLLAAGHGSTIAYTDKAHGYTIEHHEENDKRVYDTFIGETQDFMFERFKEITQDFKTVCYDYDLEQYEMVDHALRIGLFASKRKVAREVDIYKGFYQNVGNFSVGLAMGENFGRKEKLDLIKNFFLYPEEAFRYVLRLKPMLMRSKKYVLAYLIPSFMIYWYIKFRCKRKGLVPKKMEYTV